jgi:hypothetical protein
MLNTQWKERQEGFSFLPAQKLLLTMDTNQQDLWNAVSGKDCFPGQACWF